MEDFYRSSHFDYLKKIVSIKVKRIIKYHEFSFEASVEDILSDVLFNMLNRKTLETDFVSKDHLYAYLNCIVKGAIIDLIRRRKVRPVYVELEEKHVKPLIPQDCILSEYTDILTEKEKKIVKLRILGYCYREIGEVFNCKESNILYLLKTIRKKINEVA
jgi:RNA polymerase sigma factor (sigma-70 family)